MGWDTCGSVDVPNGFVMIATEMPGEYVTAILESLEAAGVKVCVDGGWGVDALVGEQTRRHADLDLVIDMKDLPTAQKALEATGFRQDQSAEPGLPSRYVTTDGEGRQVDLHPVLFDEQGNGWQKLSETGRSWGRYPAPELNHRGTINGREVMCLSPELQFSFRLGYEWSDRDEHDLRLLSARFGVGPFPPGASLR